MRSKSNTVAEASVRLGGTFADLASSEERHRRLLSEAQRLVGVAESKLAAERSKTAALSQALLRIGEAASAGVAAGCELCCWP